MAQTLKARGVTLPSPVKISSSDEIIWSSRTGRSAASGKMLGDVIAEKKTIDVEWGILTETELNRIRHALTAGFFSFSLYDGEEVSIMVYRGTIQTEHLGYIGDGTYYYKSATVSIIQQ
ncbi:MAG: hypothetical protein Q4F79_05670 [Eubacteriales bacterium]|nr:hypothetical protein [Eubacteriales bacterium]